jgi:hypothetical protein
MNVFVENNLINYNKLFEYQTNNYVQYLLN